jgi:hypothetical protein
MPGASSARYTGEEVIDFHLSLAISGWLSFRNFGMPDIGSWVTIRGSRHANLF